MGSKTALLRGVLGEVILREARTAVRFVDLFAGSGSVSHFVAEQLPVEVLSVDLQAYARELSGAITERTATLQMAWINTTWTAEAEQALKSDRTNLALLDGAEDTGKEGVLRARAKSGEVDAKHFITRHYGGHYFSPRQAYALDTLYASLPVSGVERTVGLAALLHTASVCAAAPGHTAQPFQPTEKLLPYIQTAWKRDVIAECQAQVSALVLRKAKREGRAIVESAIDVVAKINADDVVFCDPPYSAAQYSRFYHVLEGIALGGWPSVAGSGRAPSRELRETSDFSMKSTAKKAMKALLVALRSRGCRVIITFPDADASNGLSSTDIIAIAKEANWVVVDTYVASSHSTLGGSSIDGGRGGRIQLKEAVLVLSP
jgi:adenine-specific DNA-methyltransferase